MVTNCSISAVVSAGVMFLTTVYSAPAVAASCADSVLLTPILTSGDTASLSEGTLSEMWDKIGPDYSLSLPCAAGISEGTLSVKTAAPSGLNLFVLVSDSLLIEKARSSNRAYNSMLTISLAPRPSDSVKLREEWLYDKDRLLPYDCGQFKIPVFGDSSGNTFYLQFYDELYENWHSDTLLFDEEIPSWYGGLYVKRIKISSFTYGFEIVNVPYQFIKAEIIHDENNPVSWHFGKTAFSIEYVSSLKSDSGDTLHTRIQWFKSNSSGGSSTNVVMWGDLLKTYMSSTAEPYSGPAGRTSRIMMAPNHADAAYTIQGRKLPGAYKRDLSKGVIVKRGQNGLHKLLKD